MQAWNPHQYQIETMRRAVTAVDGAFAAFADPGLGKTSMSYGVISILKEHGMFKRALVVAPRRPMMMTWPAEQAKWEQFAGITYATAYGNAAARRFALDSTSDILLTHYDLLASRGEAGKKGSVVGLIDEIIAKAERDGEFPFDVLILDESTKIKNHGTERFKALKKIAMKFKRRILLTGTPAPRGLGDLFGQIYIADGGKRLGANVTRFRASYMSPKHLPNVPVPLWIPQPDADERIFGRISDMCYRLSATDYLDMPELLYNTVAVKAPDAVMALYRRFKQNYTADIGAGKVTAGNAAAAATKLRQIASGTVYTDQGAEDFHSAKVEALLDLIEEQAGQPLMVAVAFRSEVDTLRAALAKEGYNDVPALYGGVSDRECSAIEARWNHGDIPVLLVHPTTVSLGLNLQSGGNAVCWYSLTWNLEEFIQTIARVWRQGQQAKTCIVHLLLTTGTIDVGIAAALTAKEATQDRLFDEVLKHMEKDND